MPFLSSWLPGGVSNPSRCQRVYLPRKKRNLPSALSLLLGKAPVSCLVRTGWLSSTLCAPNSDSKKEKDKSRPGKDVNIHGPLESEGLLIKMVRMDWVAHGFFQWTSLWVGDGDSPFLGACFHVGVTALQRRGSDTCGSLKGVKLHHQWVDVGKLPQRARRADLEFLCLLAVQRLLPTRSPLHPNVDQATASMSLPSLLCASWAQLGLFHLRTFWRLGPVFIHCSGPEGPLSS